MEQKRIKPLRNAILFCVLAASTGVSRAADHIDKSILEPQAFHAETSCFYFTLNGVAVADPVVPSSPWFAISRAEEGAKEAFAMLLAPRSSGSLVRVVTNGPLACGYPPVVLRP